jgi:hypothetical protein
VAGILLICLTAEILGQDVSQNPANATSSAREAKGMYPIAKHGKKHF